MSDKVTHPAHYGGDTTYEAIKVIRAWGLNFELGNAAKYLCRAGKKESESRLQDLEKAYNYIGMEIAEEKERIRARKFLDGPSLCVFCRRRPFASVSDPAAMYICECMPEVFPPAKPAEIGRIKAGDTVRATSGTFGGLIGRVLEIPAQEFFRHPVAAVAFSKGLDAVMVPLDRLEKCSGPPRAQKEGPDRWVGAEAT